MVTQQRTCPHMTMFAIPTGCHNQLGIGAQTTKHFARLGERHAHHTAARRTAPVDEVAGSVGFPLRIFADTFPTGPFTGVATSNISGITTDTGGGSGATGGKF